MKGEFGKGEFGVEVCSIQEYHRHSPKVNV